MHRLDVRLQRGFGRESFAAGGGCWAVVPLTDGDGEVGVRLGCGG